MECPNQSFTLLNTDAAVEQKTFGPVQVGDDFRIRFNSELYELLKVINIVQRINIPGLS